MEERKGRGRGCPQRTPLSTPGEQQPAALQQPWGRALGGDGARDRNCSSVGDLAESEFMNHPSRGSVFWRSHSHVPKGVSVRAM